MTSFSPDSPAARGQAAALATSRANLRQELDEKISDTRRKSLNKEVNQPSRDNYDRAYDAMETVAQRWANATGESVTLPIRDAAAPLPAELLAWAQSLAVALQEHDIEIPPLAEPSQVVIIGPKYANPLLTAQGVVAKPAGMGKSGKGGPAPGYPGSDANNAWLATQGAVT